jgi:heme A synthase
MTPERMNLIIYGAGGIAQLVQLGLQAYAYRRTPHVSIGVLAVASLAGLVYLSAAAVITLVTGYARLLQLASVLMLVSFGLQIILGVWGTASLLRSYRQLSTRP